MRPRAPLALLTAALVAVGLVFTITVDDDGPDGPHPPRTITIRVDGVDPGVAPDKIVTAPAPAVTAVANTDEFEDPLSQGDAPDAPTALDGDPLPQAGQEFPGCRTAFVRNQSSRGGVRPQAIVWHITAGPDRPGWGDNDALTAMSNNPANGVSWTFSIGSTDGNCAYNVPLSMKPWTQAAANPYSVGIEVINAGTEPYFVQGAGRARLLEVTRELGKRLGIPMQPAIVSECRLVRPGIIQHKDLDQATTCAGGHNDAANSRPQVEAEIRRMIAELGGPQVTKRDRRSCRRIHAYRARSAARRIRGAERRQQARRKFVRGHDLKCKQGKAVPA